MNLLLLRAGELDDAGRATLGGPRAGHLLAVLGVAPGRTIRCGLVDGPLGRAVVTATRPDRGEVDVACAFDREAPARPADVLLLAVPRPKVLRRVAADATALGFGTIVLMRTWRVDRSHLDSHAATPDALEPHLLAGLQQARRTWLPQVVVEPLFKPFVEDRLDRLAPATRFVAHPDGATPVADVRFTGPFALAIGPERGFTDYELAVLEGTGFAIVRSDAHPLRVETAVAAITAQLTLLRALAPG